MTKASSIKQEKFRKNISTFWNHSKLGEFLKTLPKTKCYAGDGPLTNLGYSDDGHYLSVVDTIVSTDMVKSIIVYKNTLDMIFQRMKPWGLFSMGIEEQNFIS